MEKEESFGKGGGLLGRDWTQGSIVKNLLHLSWPIILTEGLYTLGISIDMIWVGRLGSAAIAGVGMAGIFATLIMLVMNGLSAGMRATIARFIGAGDMEGANHAAQQAMIISLAYTVFMTTIGLFIAEPALKLIGLEADVVAEGAAYLKIMFASSVTVAYWILAYSVMQASGDTVTPLKIIIVFRIIHVIICPCLVFGWWLFPSMGASGAAVANLISRAIGMIIGLWILFTGRSRLRLTLKDFRIDIPMIWRMVRIGIPASVMGVQRSLGLIVIAWLMVPFGTVAVAAHSLVQRVEMLMFPICAGFGLGSGVLVGQNLGARQPERSEKSAWLAVGFAEGLMIILSVAIFLAAEHVIRIFNNEPLLVETASAFLRIAVGGFLFLGFAIVLMQSLSGAGDTLPAMLVSIIMAWAIQLPLAILLPRFTELGVYGVRWALAAGIFAGAVIYTVYFKTGRWKRKRV